ncbi:hypothetical protein [Rhizobium hidalgonense]|uniref:Uncharacterized protein n=1 Tax=Rhizobium hidalgonense TaxID=1538159 RepID=A0ABX4JSV9_9HYPH|nr:hypothetical protein [Rhizobium hidalgonense]PDT21822.1 hypothetical protein CO674_19945 [Rhizobium hidalgonense]PON08480.1 hypothetical protein ATY29_05645 [Rhizobium hidalgonense]
MAPKSSTRGKLYPNSTKVGDIVQTSFNNEIGAQKRATVRPEDPQDLLIRPVLADPDGPGDWKGSWLLEHGTKLRFYVGGLDWFLTTAKMTIEQLANYKDEAVVVAQKAGWRRPDGVPPMAQREMSIFWEKLAKPQFYQAKKGESLQFSKAALVILTCELALEDRLSKQKAGRLNPQQHMEEAIDGGTDVYSHMAIVPACWHVSNLTTEYLEKQNALRPSFLRDLAQEIGQEETAIKEAALGHTLSYGTVRQIADYCSEVARASQPAGEIRVTSGRGIPGTLRATGKENLSLDD